MVVMMLIPTPGRKSTKGWSDGKAAIDGDGRDREGGGDDEDSLLGLGGIGLYYQDSLVGSGDIHTF